MSGSYRECSQCGKRALGIATRCPGCGSALMTPVVHEVRTGPDLRRLFAPKVVGGIFATLIVLGGAGFARTHRPPKREPARAAESGSTLPGEAYTSQAAARVETPAATSPAAATGEVLVARTWTNVRKSRDKAAAATGVLLPGDTVVADSLDHGWYRVTLEGKVLGYVSRSTLARP